MALNLYEKKVNIFMIEYMNVMVDNFTTNLNPNDISLYPETLCLFNFDEGEKMTKEKS